MKGIILSILIPSTPDRRTTALELSNLILGGLSGDIVYGMNRNILMPLGVEVLIYEDDKTLTIGEKRELLYKAANGQYSWQIDSDDSIAPNAIQLILEAIKNNPGVDCISFKERCIINGEYKSSNFSHKYAGWADNVDGYSWVRDIFYKCVIKTSIAQSVPFPKIRYNEDEQWGKALKPFIQTEHHIDSELYYYIHNSKPEEHAERYGLNR